MTRTSSRSHHPAALPGGPQRLSFWIRATVLLLAVLIPVLLAVCDVYFTQAAR